jgi:hypothetical protein
MEAKEGSRNFVWSLIFLIKAQINFTKIGIQNFGRKTSREETTSVVGWLSERIVEKQDGSG